MLASTTERKQVPKINLTRLLPQTMEEAPLDSHWLDLVVVVEEPCNMDSPMLDDGVLVGITIYSANAAIVGTTPTYGTCTYPNCNCLE